MSAPLSPGAALAMGAVVMSPLAGAAIALHQHSWEPLGYGAVAAAAVFVAFAVGAAVVGARQARTEALRAENEVHPSCADCERRRAMSWGEPSPQTFSGYEAAGFDGSVVRRGSESGERATDVTDATESPGPATGGA